ncbi:MAG: metal ABC transporter permease [Planctomycetota bacterium]|nr:MAG: metal ABC transporter permease [Planctomycetota bacterium]
MSEFFHALMTQPFLQVALAGGILASVACGIVGSYVVARRITYIAGGIAHCVLGGMGAAYWLRHAKGWAGCEPIYGAVASALLAAVIIGWVSLRAKQWEDTIIGALWAMGMAVGVLFIAATPGYNQDLIGYLFGNILMISTGDLWLIAALDLLVVAVGLGMYKQFLAVCFDEEFARTRGVAVDAYYISLLCLTALTVVLLATVVGIVMVIALLTLPVAIAGVFARRLWQVMIIATILSMALVTLGMAVSYSPELPPGATIITLAGGLYLLVVSVRAILRRGKG